MTGQTPVVTDPGLRVVARYGQQVEVLDRTTGMVARASLRQSAWDAVCGDSVHATVKTPDRSALEPSSLVVNRIEPRKNVLERIDGSGRQRKMAANVDQVWIVVAPWPELPKQMIDRFLVGIWNLPASPGVIISKADKIGSEAGRNLLTVIQTLSHLGVPILSVSAHSGQGISALRKASAGVTNVLVGPSGVGKSSLIRALLPGTEPSIALHDHPEQPGQHTTTVARWYSDPNPSGGAWIDSPGIRDFTPQIGGADCLTRGFPDLAAHATSCRFRDCSHHSEPDCAVVAATEKGSIPAARLDAWRALYHEQRGDSLRNSGPSRNRASRLHDRRN